MTDLNRKAAGLGEYSDDAANENERPESEEPEEEVVEEVPE